MRPLACRLALLGACFGLGAGLGGCRASRPNPEHCFHAEGDQTCAERSPDRPHCEAPACGSAAYGCVAEPPQPECYSPCGGGATSEEDSSCVEVAEDESDTETETETETGGTETGELPCGDHDECPEDAGFCFFGVCTPCDETLDPDSACAVLTEGETPICLAGECVACTEDDVDRCVEDSLACDLESNACVACSDHGQCPGGAGCDLAMGTCLSPDAVYHVDGDGGRDFTTIAEALAELDSGPGDGSGTLIIHEVEAAPEFSDYAEGISVIGDRVLVVYGAEGELPTLFDVPITLELADGARVYARNLWLRGERAVDLSNGAHVELDGCLLGPHSEYGVYVEQSELVMRNSMVRDSNGEYYSAVLLVGLCTVEITYSTLLGLSPNAPVTCIDAVLGEGSKVRNSLIGTLAPEPFELCEGIEYSDNGIEEGDAYPGNVAVAPFETTWFSNFWYGDLHLTDAVALGVTSAAVWVEGDPAVDIDGDPRPASEGSPDFAGADRIP